MLTQITSGREFDDDHPHYVPVNEYVRKAIGELSTWILEGKFSSRYAFFGTDMLPVANVPDAEAQYHAHEFLDATVQPKVIYITPNEVYKMHALLSRHIDDLVS